MNIDRLYRPLHRYFRTKRMRQFWHRFGLTPETLVLDIGGTPFNWSLLSDRPRLVMLNISPPQRERDSPITWLVADGRHLPFKDEAFDVIYSNSVIVHLGSLETQRLFANECRRVGLHYYVQTPNKWFPIEPHFITPFIHWLPRGVQRRLLRNFTVRGLITRMTQRECEDLWGEIRLLDERELQQLFPEAKIWYERMLGLTKSLIAVRI